MSKTIDFQCLARIIRDLDNIFDEEMNDYPDRRVISANERAIERWFKKMDADEQMKRDTHRLAYDEDLR